MNLDRTRAIEACQILNDLIGDIVVSTRTIEIFKSKNFKPLMTAVYKIAATRFCVFQIVLSLYKILEFDSHYRSFVPNKMSDCWKIMIKEIKSRGVKNFRNTLVGHIWNKQMKRPISNKEHDEFENQLYGGDFNGFLLWINNPNDNTFPKTVISIVETAKKKIAEDYKIDDSEIFEN
ncbi:MAG: hypothetical protein NTZ24_14310 [Deltaproteobacteria bacterium]|nr:hypothetical protein [Deltaproteobacteria bacterium]